MREKTCHKVDSLHTAGHINMTNTQTYYWSDILNFATPAGGELDSLFSFSLQFFLFDSGPSLWEFSCNHRQPIHPCSSLAFTCSQGRRGLTEPIPAVSGRRRRHASRQFIGSPRWKTNKHSQTHTFWQFTGPTLPHMYVFGPWKEDWEPTQTWGERAKSTQKGHRPRRYRTGNPLAARPQCKPLHHRVDQRQPKYQNTKKEWQVKDNKSQIYDKLTKFWSGRVKFKDKPTKKNPIQFQ